jgi:hypothetical protein
LSRAATPVTAEDEALHCICGSLMKRITRVADLRYLDFLREGIATEEEVAIDKE